MSVYGYRTIGADLAEEFIAAEHYSHRMLAIPTLCVGMFEEGTEPPPAPVVYPDGSTSLEMYQEAGPVESPILRGVCVFGNPSSTNVADSILGKAYGEHVVELVRLACNAAALRNAESQLISNALRILKQEIPHLVAVVSFADPWHGHVGTIYQATNWLYTGVTGRTTFYRDRNTGEMEHTRLNYFHGDYYSHSGMDKTEAELRDWEAEERGGKHRYVMLLGSPSERRKLRKALQFPVLPYPKAVPLKQGIEFSGTDMRPVLTLRLNELAARIVPEMNDEEFRGLVEDVRQHGILEPLLVTLDGQIIDGRHRWRAAQEIGLVVVPVRFCPPLSESDLVALVVSLAAQRRHLTPSQRAALVAMAVHAARIKEETTDGPAPDRKALAAAAGVSERTMQDALSVAREDPEALAPVVSGERALYDVARDRKRIDESQAADDKLAASLSNDAMVCISKSKASLMALERCLYDGEPASVMAHLDGAAQEIIALRRYVKEWKRLRETIY